MVELLRRLQMIFNLIKHAKQLLYNNSGVTRKTTDVQSAIDRTFTEVDDILDCLGKSKNVLNYSNSTTTKNGVKFKVNADKSITVTGTPTADTYFRLECEGNYLAGGYILSGCPTHIAVNGVTPIGLIKLQTVNAVDAYGATGIIEDTGEGKTFFNMASIAITCQLYISANATIPDEGYTFYPMLRLSYENDDTYEPYRDEGLIQEVESLQETVATMTDDLGWKTLGSITASGMTLTIPSDWVAEKTEVQINVVLTGSLNYIIPLSFVYVGTNERIYRSGFYCDVSTYGAVAIKISNDGLISLYSAHYKGENVTNTTGAYVRYRTV